MNRRLQGVGLGLSFLALVGVGGVMTGNGVFAQDATPPPGTSTTTEETTPERSAFLDAFAAQLGVTDQAKIDAAIKATVTQLVNEKVAAGDLTQAQADEILAKVDSGDVPFEDELFGDHHGGKGEGRGGHDRGNDGEQNDDEGQSNEDSTDNSTTPADESTPAASTAVFS